MRNYSKFLFVFAITHFGWKPDAHGIFSRPPSEAYRRFLETCSVRLTPVSSRVHRKSQWQKNKSLADGLWELLKEARNPDSGFETNSVHFVEERMWWYPEQVARWADNQVSKVYSSSEDFAKATAGARGRILQIHNHPLGAFEDLRERRDTVLRSHEAEDLEDMLFLGLPSYSDLRAAHADAQKTPWLAGRLEFWIVSPNYVIRYGVKPSFDPNDPIFKEMYRAAKRQAIKTIRAHLPAREPQELRAMALDTLNVLNQLINGFAWVEIVYDLKGI